MLVSMRRIAAALVLASLVAAGTARADERVECARAYEQAQRLQQRGENRKALDSAERCAQSTCPALLVDECKSWVPQIRQHLVPLDVRVTGNDGCVTRNVTVEIDRGRQASSGELFVDPGVHEVRVIDPATDRSVDKTINVARGERHVVELGFAPEGAACPDAAPLPPGPRPGIPKLAVGLGLAGGVLLLTGITLGVVGVLERDDLDACKPNCSEDQLDGPRTFFIAGDVVGTIGILTLGAATAAFFLLRDSTRASAVRAAARGIEIRF